ncbi:MAG: NAD-dependent epimerase/dehydratase family protein [Terriglobia bacterium]
MSKKIRTVGVTGATGTIGQAFVRFLVRRSDVRVLALVRRQPRLAEAKIRTTLGDLFNRAALEWLVSQSDVIVHLAARNPRTDEQDRKEQVSFFATNSAGAMNIARLAAQHRKQFVHVSSVAVYELSERTSGIFDEQEQLPGRSETRGWAQKAEAFFAQVATDWMKGSTNDLRPEIGQFLESWPPPQNEGIYPLSKFLGEPPIEMLPKGVILRLSDVYGPGRKPRGIIQDCLSALLGGGEVVIDFGPRGLVSFICIRDVLQVLLAAVTTSSDIPQVINVASPISVSETSLEDFLKEIRSEAGFASAIRVRRTTPAQQFRTFDVTKMKQYWGFEEPMSLREGLRYTIHYLRHAPQQEHDHHF